MIEQYLYYCRIGLLKAEAISKRSIRFRLDCVLGGAGSQRCLSVSESETLKNTGLDCFFK